MTATVIVAVTSLLILFLMVVKYASRAHHWELVAKGEIEDPLAHEECIRQRKDLNNRITYFERQYDEQRKQNAKLTKLFTEKIQPVVNQATEELAAWIKEEEAELTAKDKP